MTRRIAVGLWSAVLVLALAQTALAQTTIVHWQHHSPARLAMVEQMAQEFMAEHPGVTIEIQSIPLEDYYTKLLPALAAGSGPDVFQIRATDVPRYVEYGVLAPLDPSVVDHEQALKEFVPATISYLESDGVVYGLPTDVQTIVLFYNTEIFKEVGLSGPPSTWDQLVEYAQRIVKRDATGMTTRMGAAHGSYTPVILSYMAQTGTGFLSEDGKALFNNEEALKAFAWVAGWVTEYGIEDLNLGSRWTAFRNQELGMVMAHPAMLGSFRSTHPDLPIGIAQIPVMKEGQPRTNVLTSWAYVQSAQAEGTPEATEWIAYLTSVEAQRRWTSETGELPARLSLIGDDTLLDAEPLLREPLNSLEHAVPYPFEAQAEMETAVRKAVQMVTIEGMAPSEALSWLAREAERIYGEVVAAEY
ncbi:ABC transporter substrate-binding protein [Limnochorda pilosa]|uniref:ABC transporter substrate-binding protein n=1 Tax=Limnochorda pilosa TaxID=1555112 RepID=A0A0K2SI24_LIMPI|nr:ABC transporter substrate-binding protein [Limnochorda pilosa]BAS26776.1 ABC transporter substrate-binding protein [Limnochorda pilosa]